MNPIDNHPSDDILNEYLDGVLLSGPTAELENHLSRCPTCTRRLETLQQVFAELSEMPQEKLTVSLADQVVRRIKQQSSPVRLVPQVLTAAQAVVTLFLLVIFGQTISNTILFSAQITLQSMVRAILQTIGDLFTPFFNLWPRFSSSVIPLPAAPLPIIQAIILLAGLALVWLAGNSLLILDTRRQRRKP